MAWTNQLVVARSDIATAASRSTSLVGRGITALNAHRETARLAEVQLARYQAARAVLDRQFDNGSKTVFTHDEAKTLYMAYCTLRELADAGFMRACYPLARVLRRGWRILPREEASSDVLAVDRVERIRRYVKTHALSSYQNHDLAALVAENPRDLVGVIEWCAEHYPAAIHASKAPPECAQLMNLDESLDYEEAALAWLDSPDSPDDNEVWYDIGAINWRGHAANDNGRAFECLLTAANGGFASAQCFLGAMYRTGDGVKRDDTEAARWYQLSAEQGDATAQVNLAGMYLTGVGVKKNVTEVLRLYRLRAQQADAVAQNNLGWLYRNGISVEQNDTEAARWCQLSAEQGFAPAQNILGQMYQNGRGVAQDDTEALRWYRLSAQEDHAPAQLSLGWMHQNGRGVERDFAEAARWYQLSAEQGDAMAQLNLAGMYLRGIGVKQNMTEAVRLYRLRADEGDAIAQYNLGLAYEFGRGVTRDMNHAQDWYQKSADQNNADAMGQLTVLLKAKMALSGGS